MWSFCSQYPALSAFQLNPLPSSALHAWDQDICILGISVILEYQISTPLQAATTTLCFGTANKAHPLHSNISNKQPISLAVSGVGVPGISPPLVCCCCCAAQLVLTQKADPRSNEGSGSVLQRYSAAVLDLTLQHPGHHALHPACRGEGPNFIIDILPHLLKD